MENLTQKAKDIIASNIYMTIASASTDGQPWVSPVFFACDSDYNLFWVSNKDARHSKLLRKNPCAAIVMFDSTAPEGEGCGVYFETQITELSDDADITHAMKILGERVTKDEFKVKDKSEVTGDGAWRIYRATPQEVSILTSGEVNGQFIDFRQVIDLKKLDS